MTMLTPPAYLVRLRDRLRSREPGRWQWFASDSFAEDYAETVRLELLQSTYRMDEGGHRDLYAVARRCLAALELEVPVTFYQADSGEGVMNASLCFLPGEAHVILKGPVLATLKEAELAALIGHELAHYRLWTWEACSLRLATEIIESIAIHDGASRSHVTTTLRARRWTEIFADRGSLVVCGDPRPVIACLVKVATGLSVVNAESYVKQADEIFAKKALSSDGQTHPESFIRARAVWQFHEKGAEAEPLVTAMVQGPTTLDTLDILEQEEMSLHTRSLVAKVLEPQWFRSETVLAHARAFFPEAEVTQLDAAPLPGGLHASIGEYLAYVLLDFAVVDEGQGEVALAHAWNLAQLLGLTDPFEKIAREELKITKRAFEELKKQVPSLLERAAAQALATP
jgi:hypothetical protein